MYKFFIFDSCGSSSTEFKLDHKWLVEFCILLSFFFFMWGYYGGLMSLVYNGTLIIKNKMLTFLEALSMPIFLGSGITHQIQTDSHPYKPHHKTPIRWFMPNGHTKQPVFFRVSIFYLYFCNVSFISFNWKLWFLWVILFLRFLKLKK